MSDFEMSIIVKLTVSLIIQLSLIPSVFSARILSMSPFPGKSHYIFHSAVLKTLAERGHHIVEYSPFPPKQPLPNYTHVEVHTSFENLLDTFTYNDLVKDLLFKKFYGLGAENMWNSFYYDMCDGAFKDNNIKKLMQSDEHFDLVITSSTFGQESMLVFGHKFGAPTITVQGFQYSCTLNREAGNALSIATIPDSMSFDFTDKMSFKERLQNFLSVTLTMILYYTSHLPRQDALVRKYYKHSNTPPLADMVTNISLTLVNTHPAVAYAQPYTPNIIPIGGISISPERKQLPQDIKAFMDEATDGAIYFSFGTIVPTHTIPLEILQIFINVFKKLPNKVLWKINTESLPDLPKNVKLIKWVPQIGVLEHPNCAVFITQGGLFSQQEALHAGVPVLGIPFFADQYSNTRFNEYRGIGIQLDLNSLSETVLHNALTTILNNSSYKENALRLSYIYRDRPMSPADSAVFWVEYVLRHHGAAHLRPASVHLAWYQLTLLDILAAIGACVLILVYLLYYVVRKALSFLFGRKKGGNLPKEKKKN